MTNPVFGLNFGSLEITAALGAIGFGCYVGILLARRENMTPIKFLTFAILWVLGFLFCATVSAAAIINAMSMQHSDIRLITMVWNSVMSSLLIDSVSLVVGMYIGLAAYRIARFLGRDEPRIWTFPPFKKTKK